MAVAIFDLSCAINFWDSDNDNGKYLKYVCVTTSQTDTKYNPKLSPNPTILNGLL